MKTFKIRTAIVAAPLAALFLLAPTGTAVAQNKIGVIDFQRVLRESIGGKAAKAEIESRGESVEASLKKERDDLERLKTKLEAEARVMSVERREEEERQFRIRVNDFKSLQQKRAREFKRFEGEVIERVQREVFELVNQIGDKNGFTLIAEKGLILYNDDSIDVTDQLITLYNAQKR
ncbi:MAG: OmpH family outer membrane protein [Desulfococcaceae bacterium]